MNNLDSFGMRIIMFSSYHKGLVLWRIGKYRDALRCVDKAIRLNLKEAYNELKKRMLTSTMGVGKNH
jgi:hypothetical protein